MKKILRLFIPFLKRLIISAERYTKVLSKKNISPIHSLAPKIITDKAELQRIKPYLENIESAIDAEGVNNIAITGSYGSGKSTIIKTFQYANPQYEYLNISLASFKDNKEDGPGNREDEDLQRRLEISILQQMFYHVKPSKIPDTRFKRIINLSNWQLLWYGCFFLIFLFSGLQMFYFGYVQKLDTRTWLANRAFDWFAFIIIVLFSLGIGFFVKSVLRLFSNSKIRKLNIKGELELGESIDKSVFNQHLDEILYFFERNKYDVVVIEDVDRFESTDIFTKLREINILINQSELVNHSVKFLYAIRDDMFTDANERVKFFEFIIPIISFINPSNASEQLSTLITNAKLDHAPSLEFTKDVVTFIDAIDMRLLINIFQEYRIYSTNLSKELQQDNLFAIIVYKNMFPDDFGELPRRKGKLYKFLSGRLDYQKELKIKFQNNLDKIDALIEVIEDEFDKPIKELRSVYINALVAELKGFGSFYFDKDVSPVEVLDDEYFDILKQSSDIKYVKFQHEYSNNYTIQNGVSSTLTLASVEKSISNKTYAQREQNLLNRYNGQIEKLKTEKEELRQEMQIVDSMGISEIFEKIDIDKYLGDFKDNYLMRYLLLNGYLNENYNDYISIFHGVNLTQSDFIFEAKIKSGISQAFDYQLTKVENLLERLPEKYFRREAILNYALTNGLLKHKAKHLLKYNQFFATLKEDTDTINSFILGFIDLDSEFSGKFIAELCSVKPKLWSFLKDKSNLPIIKLNAIVKLIFEHTDIKSIQAFDEVGTLEMNLQDNAQFVEFASTFQKTTVLKEFILTRSVLISALDLPVSKPNKIFEFLYEENAYIINPENIATIIRFFKNEFDEKKFNEANYTMLCETGLENLVAYIESRISTYIENVFLKLPRNNGENEGNVVLLLNNDALSIELKQKIAVKVNSKIMVLDEIEDTEVQEMLIVLNKVEPTWINVFEYYDGLDKEEINGILTDYFNYQENYLALSKSKIRDIEALDDQYISDFGVALIFNEGLNLDSYSMLLQTIPKDHEGLDYARISKDKINWLVESKFISLSPADFDGLKSVSPPLHIRLIELHEQLLLDKLDEYSFDANDWVLIFESSIISLDNKVTLIEKMDYGLIIQNEKIAKIVCYLLSNGRVITLDFEVLMALFTANPSIKSRIELLLKYIVPLSNDQIQTLIEKLGDEYARVFIKQNKPTFSSDSYNYELFEILKTKEMINSSNFINNKNEIKVVANY